MGKLVLWLALAGAVWIGWTLWRIGARRAAASARERRRDAPAESATDSAASHAATEPHPESIVRCEHCGLYLPKGDSVADDADRRYCSTAHRDAVQQRTGGTHR